MIIDHGRAVAAGTPMELKRRIGGNVVEVHVRNGHDLPGIAELLGELDHGTAQIDESTRRVSAQVESGSSGLMSALRSVEAAPADAAPRASRAGKRASSIAP